jgi:hypothetical protein
VQHRARSSTVEHRPFKPRVPGSNPGALRKSLQFFWGNGITARILGFKLRDGGSIPSSPVLTIFWGIAKWYGIGLWNRHAKVRSLLPQNNCCVLRELNNVSVDFIFPYATS